MRKGIILPQHCEGILRNRNGPFSRKIKIWNLNLNASVPSLLLEFQSAKREATFLFGFAKRKEPCNYLLLLIRISDR